MNYLIGDIGNTSIKICKINKDFKIIQTLLFETKSSGLDKNLNKKFFKILKKNTNKNILFSSVVPKVYKKVRKKLKKKKFNVFEIKQFDLKKIMKFKVKKYSQLGSDRIANALGASYKYKSNCIVIDFGTATTFDIIKKKSTYEGGIIAPGVKLSIENLFYSTALLPMFKLKNYPTKYGKNTKDALAAGFFWGYEGLINNIINKIIKKNSINFQIVLTGGYSSFFKNYLVKKAKVENNITMLGIIKIYKEFLI